MLISVTSQDGNIISFNVADDIELMNVRVIIETESGIESSKQRLFYQGRELLGDDKTLKQLGITHNSMLLLQSTAALATESSPSATATATTASSSVSVPPMLNWGNVAVPKKGVTQAELQRQQLRLQLRSRAEMIRTQMLSGMYSMSMLRQNDPDMARAIEEGDLDTLVDALEKQFEDKRKAELDHARQLEILQRNPFDVEAQQKIADAIRQENVSANLNAAMEHNPEMFGHIHMLYVSCKVNGVPIKGFVDSGAQMTIMNEATAERCGLMRLLDTRYHGVATGVGSSKILGAIHVATIQLGNDFLPARFNVLEAQSMELLIGLDLLKRHQCCIDLKENVLRIGTTGGSIPFLSEADLPKSALIEELSESKKNDGDKKDNNNSTSESVTSTITETNNGPSVSFPPKLVADLVALSSRSQQEVLSALEAAGGNAELAASFLLGK